FQSPMGLALADGGSKLAVGTTLQVWEFRDVPSVARRLEPAGRHDACFLPRSSHVTGNVLIHEMAYGAGAVAGLPTEPQGPTAGLRARVETYGQHAAGSGDPRRATGVTREGELWIVNTRFSCLATLDPEASFVPRWRPPFVTELEPSDRCHLNGLGMVDG